MLLPFFLMTPIQAANMNQATQGRADTLEARLVAAGPYAGKYVFGTEVADDPNFEDLKAMFAVLPVAAIETDEAWPYVEETE